MIVEQVDSVTHRCYKREDIPPSDIHWICKTCRAVWFIGDLGSDTLYRVGTFALDGNGDQIRPKLSEQKGPVS